MPFALPAHHLKIHSDVCLYTHRHSVAIVLLCITAFSALNPLILDVPFSILFLDLGAFYYRLNIPAFLWTTAREADSKVQTKRLSRWFKRPISLLDSENLQARFPLSANGSLGSSNLVGWLYNSIIWHQYIFQSTNKPLFNGFPSEQKSAHIVRGCLLQIWCDGTDCYWHRRLRHKWHTQPKINYKLI